MGKPSPGLLLAALLTLAALVGIWGGYIAHRPSAPAGGSVAPSADATADEGADSQAGNDEGDSDGDTGADDEGAAKAQMKSQPPALSQAPWDQVETVGDEGELVEVIYNDDNEWEMVGWRVKGIGLYGAPEFYVAARKWDDVPLFPCSDCHGTKREPDPRPRALTEDHEKIFVKHGNDRIWCSDCHGGKNMNFLVSRRGKPVDIDQGHVFCGECHFAQLKDFEFGVHGRRIGFHSGPRVLRTCTECHDAHQPQIAAIAPDPPPEFRENLRAFAPMPKHRPPVWERFGKGTAP